MCVCVCVRGRGRVHACMHACMHACVFVCTPETVKLQWLGFVFITFIIVSFLVEVEISAADSCKQALVLNRNHRDIQGQAVMMCCSSSSYEGEPGCGEVT